MKLAIMQPYLFPYLGYFQLINLVDNFIVYDNIEFTKKGWINRNRIRLNNKDALFTLPLEGASDFLLIKDRKLSSNAAKDIKKTLGQIRAGYAKAPHFKDVYPLIESIFLDEEKNLFLFILSSIKRINAYLEINTPLKVSSDIDLDHSLRGKDKVIALCKSADAKVYVNPIGGVELYDKTEFAHQGLSLQFHKMNPVQYDQLGDEFIPSLSIIDVMMCNSKERVQQYLDEYTLI